MLDHEGWAQRATEAQSKAAQAIARLLNLAETRNSGQIPRVAKFIAALYNGDAFPLDLFELRAVDVEISDDMLLCIDALRWGKADLHKLVPDGKKRIEAVISKWGVSPPEPPVPPDGAYLNAQLVTFGDAPGYRDISLTFDCEVIPRAAASSTFRIRMGIDAASSERIAEHIITVHRYAWSRLSGPPLDAKEGERPPRWLGPVGGIERLRSSGERSPAPSSSEPGEAG
ncbi:MAG: hypothetical protein QM750_19810 [Rubrivivax sp.]